MTSVPSALVSTPARLLKFANNFDDLEQLCQLDLNKDGDMQKLRAILKKPLGFKLMASKSIYDLVFNKLLFHADQQLLSSLVESAPAQLNYFEQEFCSFVSSIIHSEILWKFKKSENVNVVMFDYPIAYFQNMCGDCGDMQARFHTTRDRTEILEYKRPDLLCFLNGYLLFKGEERPEEEEYITAVVELSEKLDIKMIKKFLSRVPFMFGYVAAGDTVGIFAIQIKDLVHGRVVKPTQKELVCFNISNPLERLSLVIHVFNILRVLRYYAAKQFISENNYSSLLPFVKVVQSDTTIENLVDFVRKSIKLSRNFELDLGDINYSELQHVYSLMPKFKNTTKLMGPPYLHFQRSKDTLILDITPVCYIHSIETVSELVEALQHICTAIQSMHKVNVVHRDIRWANVIYDSQQRKYLLTDFEQSRLLTPEKPYTLVSSDFIWIPVQLMDQDESGNYKYDKHGDILMLAEMMISLAEQPWIAKPREQVSLNIDDVNERSRLNKLYDVGCYIRNNWREITIDQLVPDFRAIVPDEGITAKRLKLK